LYTFKSDFIESGQTSVKEECFVVAVMRLFGALMRLYGALMRLYGALMRLYGALMRLYGALMRLYGALMKMYGALMKLYGALMRLYGALYLRSMCGDADCLYEPPHIALIIYIYIPCLQS
jgi:hypothetical protein